MNQPTRTLLVRLCLSVLGLLLVVGGGLYAYLLADLPGPEQSRARIQRPSTQILDRNGRLLYEVIDPNGSKQTPLTLDQTPVACRQAVIATEDKLFYQHPGVDLLAIGRAAWQNTQAGTTVSGASTITQQLARNLLLDADERYERSLRRKLREAWLAWRLERIYSKDQVLELYLNQAYFGNFAVGIEAAAQAYFGVSARELDVAQCALLAGLLQSPSTYNPLIDPVAARNRQAVVLQLMTEQGYLDAQQAELARHEPLQYAASPFPIQAPHFVMFVNTWLERQFGSDALLRGGLRVTTTLDLDWQNLAQATAQRRLEQLRADPKASPNRRVDNAALVALHPQTGEILAMLGSPDYFDDHIQGNVNAALSLRQPGSAIKPLTYAAAFDPARTQGKGPLTPATLVSDVRTAFPTKEGDPYVPLNYDLQFHGPVLLRDALASSFNVPAVKVLQHVGVPALVELAQQLGISSFITHDDFGLALTLGGGEVRLLELTAAYGALANGGQRVVPTGVLQVADAEGNVLFHAGQAAANAARHQVLSPQVTYLITSILSDNNARVPTFGHHSLLRLTGDRPAAVKTGTTTDWKDNWTIGYTPDLVVGVWVGNADNTPMQGISGITGAGPIWHDFMENVLRDRPRQAFDRPAGLVDVEICADSGLLMTPLCPRPRWEVFLAGTEPTHSDTMHQQVTLDSRTGERATPTTPAEFRVTRTYWVLPPDLQAWAAANGIEQPPPPRTVTDAASSPATLGTLNAAPLVLTSPDAARVYRISPAQPLDTQEVQVVAHGNVPLLRVTILVNDQPLESRDDSQLSTWWRLQPGKHTFQATGTTLDGKNVASEPIVITVIDG